MIAQERIAAALAEIARPFADARTNIFQVELSGQDENRLHLTGRVLEEANRHSLVEGLSSRFSGMRIDVEGVEVLRGPSNRRLMVGTNLTSMHQGPSFLAEQATQLLNGMPVEVLWEENRWGYVRQLDGYLGWTYLPYLTDLPAAQPTHIVINPVGLLRVDPNNHARLVTRVLGGTQLCLDKTNGDWAHIQLAGGMHGWLPLADLRALDTLPQSTEARRETLTEDALRMIGVPYLWGGCSANGIDCSGFAQLLHRWVGISIPRDADMQYAAGKDVEPPFNVGDLLFFGEDGEQRRITHVGISLGGWRMIHSSRRQNGVQVDDVQAVDSLREIYLCAATYIGR